MVRCDLTVVTATIPGREALLGRCLASVYAQDPEVTAHIVVAQSCSEGLPGTLHVARQQNIALPSVATTWVMRLDDDNELLPQYTAVVKPCLDADVVYGWDVEGVLPRFDCSSLGQDELVERLRRENFIDGSAVLIRTELLRAVGGWPTDWEGGSYKFDGRYPSGTCNEDWELLLRLAQAGARFRCIPEPLWIYGHGDWARISTDE